MKYASAFARNCGFAVRILDGTDVNSGAIPTSESSPDILVIKDVAKPRDTRIHHLPFGVRTVIAGEEDILLGSRRSALRPGSVLLVPAGAEVSSTAQKGSTSVSVHFPIALASCFLFEELDAAPRREDGPAPSALLQDVPVCIRGGAEAMVDILRAINDASCATAIFDLCLTLLPMTIRQVVRVHEEIGRIPAAKLSARRELYRRACVARAAIDAAPNLSLSMLAETCCLSPFHLHRIFAAAFEATPGQYAKQRKMEISTMLLKRTGLPVKSVAHRAGFENPSAFARSFRTEYGITPLKYREGALARG